MKKNLFFASSGGANTPPAKKPWSSLQNIRRTMVFLFVMLLSVGAWAATETQPSSGASNEAIVGTSYTFAGTYVAGAGSAKAGAMTSKGIKIRLNRTSVSDTDIANALEFTVNEGYAINSITIVGVTNTNGAAATVGTIYVDGAAWNGSFDGALPAKDAGVASNIQVSGIEAQSSVVFAFSDLGGASQGNIEWTIEYAEAETCNDPEAHLAFTKSTAYVGEQFSYDYGSKSGGDLSDSYTLNGVPAVKGTDYTFTSGNITVLKAGQFVMHMITAAVGDYCAADLSDTILIYEATPVTEVTVDGPDAAYVGESVTFTATAANASNYAWTVNGVDANTNAAEFIFTPAAAGEYSIVCSARNQFNAANEWIASDAKVLTASNVSGEIIKVELTSGTAATVTGILGGTADANLSSSKKMDKGKYFGFTLAKGAFAEGDTVIITMTVKGSNYPCLFADKNKETLLYLATETSDALEYKIVLPAAATGLTSLYFARDADDATYKWNPTFTSVSVIRPMAVKSTSEAFKSVSFNGEALDANFDENHAMNVEGSYVDAPVVVFTKTVTTIYEDNSQVVKDVEVNVTAEEVNGVWQAQAEINSVTYTINATKATSFTVHYMDGETELGTENVAVAGSPAEYAQYQSKNLSTFGGWYNNADLADEHAVADMSAEVITAATTYYAKFENKYAESINMEQLVLDNGTAYDLMSFMGGKGFASNIANSLDTLNDLENKANRNYAFLGLKVKAEGKLLDFRLAANSTVKVKFGNVGATPLVSINGGEYAAMELAEGVYTYTATDEALISIKTASNATLIFKQIMIDADLAEVVLPDPGAYLVNIAETENGTVTANWENKKYRAPVGATVALTVTPAEGYQVEAVTVNGEAIEAVENAYSFIMPNAVANVAATFVSAAPAATYTVTYKAGEGTGDDVVVDNATEVADVPGTFTAPAGKVFDTWKDGEANEYAVGAAVTADLTLIAQWKDAPAEPDYLLINQSTGAVNTTDFRTTSTSSSQAYSVEGTDFANYIKLGGAFTTPVGAYETNKIISYDAKTNSVKVEAWIYNKASSDYKFYISMIEEGTETPTIREFDAPRNSGTKVSTTFNPSTNATIYLHVGNNSNVYICQLGITESGTALLQGGAIGYSVRLDLCRLANNKSASALTMDGIEYLATSNAVKVWTSGNPVKLKAVSEYIKFTTTESSQVIIEASGTYSVTKDRAYQEGDERVSNNQNLVLEAGTYYICPNGSNVTFTSLAFAEPPVAYSVTYNVNGATGDAPVQADLYEGDKFNVASAAGLEKTGYDFDGWLCSVDAAKYAAGDEYIMTAANVIFTAQWVEHVQSSDATLSALEVAGLTLSPAFDPATEAYTATLPFYASMPVVADVTATKNSEYAAAPVVTIAANVISVSVKAENNDVKTYTITVNQEAAPAASSSINIEQYVLDNRKGNNESEGIALAQAMFTAANISYANINALDSLNDDKTNRNNAYLGAKIKSNGGYLEIAVPAEKSLKVKFGNIAADVAVMINGVAQDDHSKSTEIYELAAANELRVVRLSTTTSGTVVFKQIMIGEDIADVVLPYGIAIADGIENGAIAAAKWALPGDDVAVTVTPADGYVLENLIVNEVEKGAVSSFEMPNANVTISATFVASAPTPVDPVYTVVRDGLTPGYFYTMCLANNVTAARGASFWKPAGYNDSSVELEEVVGELEAGIPYFFKATATTLEVVYGEVNAAIAGENNGLVGSFTEEDIQAGAGNYILFNNKLYEVAATQLAKVGAYRAYINIGQINNVAPAPGMRRMAMPIQRGTATGIEAIEVGAELKKVVINGQLYIVRDGRMYDVTGQLVR